MRLWYLLHRRPTKAQASLRIRTLVRAIAVCTHEVWKQANKTLDSCACAFEECVYRGRQLPLSHDMALMKSSPRCARIKSRGQAKHKVWMINFQMHDKHDGDHTKVANKTIPLLLI